MRILKIFSAAAALAAVVSTTAAAQSDFNFPTGAGAAVTSSAVNFTPSLSYLPTGAAAVTSPRGMVIVGPTEVSALRGVMGGEGAGSSSGTQLASSLGGAQAPALVSALAALSSGVNLQTATAAVTAFNNYIASLPAGSTPPAAAALARETILQAIRAGSAR